MNRCSDAMLARSLSASVGAGYPRDGSFELGPSRDAARFVGFLYVACVYVWLRVPKKKATRSVANEVQIEQGAPQDSRNPLGRTGAGYS
jgi:hypothetical protein